MAIDLAKADGRTLSQLCQDLQGETAQSAESVLRALAARLSIPQHRFTFNIMPYGTDLGPSYRSEWSELVRTGKVWAAEGNSPALAGFMSMMQLANPIGSGVVLLVRAALAVPAAAMDVLAALLQTPGAVDLGTSTVNVLSNSVASKAHTRNDNVGPIVAGVLERRNNGTNSSDFGQKSEAFLAELPEGTSLTICGTVLNTALRASFQWAEVTAAYPR